MMETPKIIFVENLERLTLCRAFSLVWIHEIHVDKKYEHSDILDDLIKHEKYHHKLLWERIEKKHRTQRIAYALWNNLWDFFDVNYLDIKWAIQGVRKK